ncbi:MAG: Flp pilus assembly complex ATPase component TadA [Treponema sp.]|nr:Flp pilus assembly complex ATPase component TadA [Treponema sp.]
METLQFKLAPAYCLFNGAAVLNQHGSEIKFLLENPDDEILQGRLKRAFYSYLDYARGMKNIPSEFENSPVVYFEKGSRAEIRTCISKIYKDEGKNFADSEEMTERKNDEAAAAVLLLDSILEEARNRGASDIHIENGNVRFRLLGKLELYISLQKEKSVELIQRIKLLGGMNVIERRKNQDGHFVYGNTNPLFIRVSSMPVYDAKLFNEESLVLRLLDTSRLPLNLSFLGFSENQLDLIKKMSFLKNGLVLVCGPTGSGKSTTVASILTEIDKWDFGSKKIISLEDPPEYVIPGVSQIQIDEKRNSFKEALIHVFRQDPDVLMIGEIRDEISAEIAVKAAMTGHLVFATLHTVSAGDALLRLENLGLDRRIIASVIRGVVCQEVEYIDESPHLFADVAFPKEEFEKSVTDLKMSLSAEELNELFLHVDNHASGFVKTLTVMGQAYKAGKPAVRIWNGGLGGKKSNRRIG